MKKIIRHVLYKTQCQFCGTEFAFEKSDIQTRQTADKKKILPFTECPNCGKETPATADKSTQITMQPATENANVSHIAKMQRQIDQFDNLFLHLHQRIHQNCICDNVIISDIDRHKTTINEIIHIIDLHTQQQTEPNPKGEQKTIYTTYKLTRREQEGKESKQCPHLQFNIGSEYCRTCRYFVSHDHVYRIVKCSYPNPAPDPSLELFKNNQQ